MDTARIRGEVEKAARTFAFVETCSTGDGAMTAKAALQTTAGNIFIVSVSFVSGKQGASIRQSGRDATVGA